MKIRRERVIFSNFFRVFFKFKLIFYSECMRCHSADKEMPKWGRSRWKTPHLWSSLPKTLSLSIFFALFGWYHLSTIDKFVPWCEKYSKIWRHFRGECTTIYSVWDIDVLYYVHTYLHQSECIDRVATHQHWDRAIYKFDPIFLFWKQQKLLGNSWKNKQHWASKI